MNWASPKPMSASTSPTGPRISPPASPLSPIAWLAAATKQIKLGTGIINLPNTHPAAVAASIAMLDRMLDGRLIFGDLGKFPDARLGEEPLAKICRRLRTH